VPHIRDVAARYATQGYAALAPDLYHGKSTLEAAEAAHLMQGLDWGRAAIEIAGAVRYLREVAGATRVGVTGFCMGGALTIIAATQPGVDAYVAFYGFPPAGAAALEKIQAPGLLLFGQDEPYFSVPDAQAFAAAQRARGREADVVIYPGAGHAFFNDTRSEVYKAEAATDAWRRALDHFGRHLR
jgi:carboxymethylenebutenolidase